MKAKNKLITALCAIGVTAFALGAAACGGGGTGITFEGWQDYSTSSVKLGEIYKVTDKKIKDTEGNVWYYDITVKDSDGDKVPLIAGEFEATDVDGYTITYELTLAENDVRTRTVEVSVQDSSAPQISVVMPTGFVNREYTIPEITVVDLSGEQITPSYKLYYKEGETKTEIAVTNGKFTPQTKGAYVLDVTATDSAGNTATLSKSFGVRAEAAENILENFDSPESLLNSINANQEWLESFEGREGVLHITGTAAEKTGYSFRFMGDKSAYKHTPFTAITVSLYAVKRADMYPTTAEGTEATWFEARAGEWMEFVITDFENWEYLFKSATEGNGAQLFWTWTKNVELYIDEIRLSATPKVAFTTDVQNDTAQIGTEVSVQASVPADNRLETWVSVKSPSGNKVTYNQQTGKFTVTEVGYYTVTALVESAELSFYNTTAEYKLLVLDNYVKVGTAFTNADIGSNYILNASHQVGAAFSLPTGVLYNPFTGAELSADVDITITKGGENVPFSGSSFTPDKAGIYIVKYTCVHEGKTYTTNCQLYVVDTTLQKGEIINFATADSLAYAKYGADGQGLGETPVWFAEYQGRAGVIRMNDTANSGFALRSQKTLQELKAISWDYLDIDIYLQAGEWLCKGAHVDSAQGPVNPYVAWTTNAWTTVSIHKSAITDVDSLLNALASSAGAHLLWGWDLGDLYIDCIRLRASSNVLNDFAEESSKADCLNGGNGVGSAATWLSSYEGASGVIKVNDGGAMGGYYIRTSNLSASEMELYGWDYIEIKVWVSSGSWIMFYNGDLSTYLTAGQWNTLKLSKATIEGAMQGNISNFYGLITGSTGVQLFWGYDDMGDVYFDSITLGKNA